MQAIFDDVKAYEGAFGGNNKSEVCGLRSEV